MSGKVLWLVWDEDWPDPLRIKASSGLDAVFEGARRSHNSVQWEGTLQFFVREDREGSETHTFAVTPKVTPVEFHVSSGGLYRPKRRPKP